MSQIVTGEAVAVDLRPATVGSRFVAALLDLLVQGAVLVVGAFAVAQVLSRVDQALGVAVVLVGVVAVVLGYPVGMETLWRGRTLGKAAMGLRVVREDGGPIHFREALVRGLLGAFVEKPGVTSGAAAVISSLVDPRGRRLGDLLAGTIVLQERVPVRTRQLPPVPPQLQGWAATLDLSGLRDDLALSARQFLGRVDDLTPEARETLGGRLVAAVAAVVTPAPPPGTPGWAYLTAVLTERRTREQTRLGARPVASGWSAGPGPTAAPMPGPTPGSAAESAPGPALPAGPPGAGPTADDGPPAAGPFTLPS